MVVHGKSAWECLVNADFLQRSILGPSIFLLYFDDLHDDFSSNIAAYDVVLLHSALGQIGLLLCYNSSILVLNLNLTCETLWTQVGNGLLISALGKLNLFHLMVRITLVVLMLKSMRQSWMKNHL